MRAGPKFVAASHKAFQRAGGPVLELSLFWGLRQWMDPTLVVLAITKELGSFLL